VCEPEVQADRLGMTDVKITVRLRWKAGENLGVLSGPQIIRHNIADKIGWNGDIGGLIHSIAAKLPANA